MRENRATEKESKCMIMITRYTEQRIHESIGFHTFRWFIFGVLYLIFVLVIFSIFSNDFRVKNQFSDSLKNEKEFEHLEANECLRGVNWIKPEKDRGSTPAGECRSESATGFFPVSNYFRKGTALRFFLCPSQFCSFPR